MKPSILLTIPLLIISLSINAEITTDGSLGSRANLSGPDYLIGADLGHHKGGNLFHSFKDFNLNSLESATFSGPNSVQNVISRVTGGNPSNIDGLIRSTIPNADFYFLNPNGIMFGPNARLDVQGSFHASTADYLRLGEGGQFDARNPSNSLLTVAPIESFGFLTDSPTSISTSSSQLSVSPENTFSLVSGNLTINNTKLSAPYGRINLASVREKGEVIPTVEDFVVPALRGDITISNNSLVDVKGKGGGSVFIRSGQLVMDNSTIYSKTLGNQDAGDISIQANRIDFKGGARLIGQTAGEGNAAKITLQAKESVIFSGQSHKGYSSRIDTRTYGTGNAGSVNINANHIALKNGTLIFAGSRGKGNGTYVNFHANQIAFAEGSSILSGSFGQGKAANINLYAKESLKLTGTSPTAIFGSRIYSGNTRGSGDAGNIYIEAQDILLTDGGLINGGASGTGNAGNIHLHVNGTITLAGVNKAGGTSFIAADAFPWVKGKGGKGGTILIEAEQLIVEEGGIISATTNATKDNFSGQGGLITIRVKGKIELSGVNPHGESGLGFGSGIYAGSRGVGNNAGNGGHIDLQAGSLALKEGAVIQNTTNNNADSGNIAIEVQNTVTITGDASQIVLQTPRQIQLEYLKKFSPANYNQSTSGIYASSSSDSAQAGNSGDINLKANKLVLQKQGIISTSSAGGGKAGNITLHVGQLQMDNSARISSESQMPNTYTFNQLAERDNRIIVRGDIVEVADIGVGKADRYFNTGTALIRTQPVYIVTDMDALYNLTKQYSIEEGDVMTVQNIGNGETARFIYALNNFYDVEEWVKIGNTVDIIFANMKELTAITGRWFTLEKIPYPSATVIQVKDTGRGKPGTFIYSSSIKNPISEEFFGNSIRLKNFPITNIADVHALHEQISLQRGDIATFNDTAQFIHNGQQWVSLNNTQKVANIAEMDNLILAKSGNLAQIVDNNNGTITEFLYSGQDWIPLHNRYEVVNLTQRNQLSVQTGDLVKVLDIGQGKTESFFYFNNEWHKRIQGGSAGTIHLTAQEMTLSNNSAIATEAVSAGGGSIHIETDKLLFLNDSQLTTSVQEGTGNGGDLTIQNPTFIVTNNSNITAQAYEGRGGNIHIRSQEFIKSPKSLVSASSKLGLDGEVNINSPAINLDEFLVVLPGGFVEAQLKQCTHEEIENPSIFKVDLTRKKTMPFERFKKLK
ncbi:filamentous hemagglutinin N-terminal domain-containing protein [Candidatus Parabeggiatoa sp. HSG14]|uniref:two-partner secretion domain-containing protein n=1 Tax=Candidatus Parabeggiatoa sp. HSG14 TaxID=3055593 RepID=UPI0025A69010|nr:filamentous hemagglutinin N-terminal domain-containing protein [Thiotrichales bacterium HSG14]